jgi:hypothetical protein
MKVHSPRGLVVRVMLACIGMTGVCLGSQRGVSPSPTPLGALMINTEAVVIALPKDRALKFTTEYNVNADPTGSLKALDQMVQNREADSVANPSVTSRNGQRGTSEAGTTKLEVEPTLGPPGDMIEVNIAFDYKGKRLATAIDARSGEIRFLGTFDSTEDEKSLTYLVFVVVRASDPMPPVTDMFDVTISFGKEVKSINSLSQTDYIPILLTLRNKRKDDVNVSTVQGYCETAIYSVDDAGKMNLVYFSGTDLNQAPEEFHVPVEVKAGKSSTFKSGMPMNFINKYKKVAFAIVATGSIWEPPYCVISKPFTASDLELQGSLSK